ncbi:unnamed protein product [Paramecium pentaurelia]|uniref:Transmembrane protein n=1 Tax=Paramecium pentaurelia TaxID=43138 RepID=A0A8S1WN28_9CILI|nr:unnamed protein product [Paramecium pentaurelia]
MALKKKQFTDQLEKDLEQQKMLNEKRLKEQEEKRKRMIMKKKGKKMQKEKGIQKLLRIKIARKRNLAKQCEKYNKLKIFFLIILHSQYLKILIVIISSFIWATSILFNYYQLCSTQNLYIIFLCLYYQQILINNNAQIDFKRLLVCKISKINKAKNKYLDPQTSDALDKYIDSFGNSSFSSLITKISSDITSEHSHFKQICKQAQQNKDLKQLVKDKNSEFMKHVLEFQNSFAPFTQTNIDEKSQSYQSSIKQKKKK